MAKRLRAHAALAEDLCSVPNIHTEAQNHLYLHFQGIHHPFLVSEAIFYVHGALTYM